MHRVGRWLDRGRTHATASTQSLDSLAESQNLEAALRAVELIMDDDIEGAEAKLSQGNSSFHKLARGTLGFIKATLGFEQEIMKEASDLLYEAESSASASLTRAQHDSRAFDSRIYDRGAEFSLCQAEAQVMSAVVGVLNESLTESIKGFYKLRKAYITLDSLSKMETKFMKTREVKSLPTSTRQSLDSQRSKGSATSSVYDLPNTNGAARSTTDEAAHANQPSALRHAQLVDELEDDESDASDEFYEAQSEDEKPSVTERYTGRLSRTSNFEDSLQDLHVSDTESPASINIHSPPLPLSTQGLLNEGPESDIFENSLDVFIHSGTSLIFGILSLMISIIPPAFSKLLAIIGFRGDRDRGLRMLWQATKFSNINGGMAGLVIFGWYNGLVGFCDIIPDSNPDDPDSVEGYPALRLQNLLSEMRRRYPKSRLWLIEEARMAASRRQLDRALEYLSTPGKSQLRQLEAFHMFERSLDAMFDHRFQLCADSFLACLDLNEWSQCLYYYVAASAHFATYQQLTQESKSPEEAEKHKGIAEQYFRTAPTKVGRKKVMGRQLPFDRFVVRKIAKWEDRARERKCSFMDAIGVSPLEEMIYLWNGYKKMNETQLKVSLEHLSWSKQSSHWQHEALDEKAIVALLEAVIWRHMRDHEKSMKMLQEEIIKHGAHEFKGQNRDDWIAPAAHYEMAVNFWMQRSGYISQHGSVIQTNQTNEQPPTLNISGDAKLVRSSKQYVEKVRSWEKYELDTRIGVKVTAASNALRRWEERHANSTV